MAEALEPGVWVECVESAESAVDRGAVIAGRIYRVIAVHPDEIGVCPQHGPCIAPIVDLEGDDPASEYGWCAAMFRPIYRPREHAFDHLLTDLPINTPEPA